MLAAVPPTVPRAYLRISSGDRAGMQLPEVVTLAADRREYKSLVHRIVKAPYGV